VKDKAFHVRSIHIAAFQQLLKFRRPPSAYCKNNF
jgi:hypothetical protein